MVTTVLIVCADRCPVLRCLLAVLTASSLFSIFFPLVLLTPLILNYKVHPSLIGRFKSVVIPLTLGMDSMFSLVILL